MRCFVPLCWPCRLACSPPVRTTKKTPPRTPVPADRAERLKKIQSGFTEEFDGLLKKFQTAKTRRSRTASVPSRELASLTAGRSSSWWRKTPRTAFP